MLEPAAIDRVEPLPAEATLEFTVLMPCLNEAETLATCIRKARASIERMKLQAEVVIADNGSTDGSQAIARAEGARVVDVPVRGYGAALYHGTMAARGRYVIMGDADDSYDFSRLDAYVDRLREGNDVVMGNRFQGGIRPGAMPWKNRYLGNPVLSGIGKLFFRCPVGDFHCGMRGFSREAFQKMRLQTTGMEFASEMVVNSLRAELKIHEIPITYRPRIGESKLSGLRDAWRHVRFMLLFSPSYLFQLPGLFLMIAGGLVMALLAGGPREIFGRTWDYHVLILGAAALILGYNLVLFDVFAKTFSMGAGFARPRQWLGRLHRWFSLERGLILGLALFLAGLGLEVKILLDWLGSGSGPLMAVRGVVIGMTAMVMGAQTVFASFLVSLMLIERR